MVVASAHHTDLAIDVHGFAMLPLGWHRRAAMMTATVGRNHGSHVDSARPFLATPVDGVTLARCGLPVSGTLGTMPTTRNPRETAIIIN
jgi:hypothetical protein